MNSVRVDHVVVPVRTNKMYPALRFFNLLFGYTYVRRVSGDWGVAKFVENDLGDALQITEPAQQQPYVENLTPECDTRAIQVLAPMLQWVHVAFSCDVKRMRAQIQEWCDKRKCLVEFEEVPGGKLFVSIPSVFWIEFELVPEEIGESLDL